MELAVNSEQRMSSLEIAELMGKQHKDVLRDIRSLSVDVETSRRSFALSSYTARGKDYPLYLLDFSGTMLLITGYDAKRRAIVIERWLELEEAEKKRAPALPQTHAEALRQLASEVEERERLEEKARLDRPKVEFAKAITESSGSLKIGEFSKVLANAPYFKRGKNRPLGPNQLFRWLRDNGYLIAQENRYNQPYQKYINQGLFVLKEGLRPGKEEGEMIPYTQTRITGKGQEAIALEITGDWLEVEDVD